MRVHYYNQQTKRHMQYKNIKRNTLKTLEVTAYAAIAYFVLLLAAV